MIAKAVGVQRESDRRCWMRLRPRRDGFVLATLGCRVELIERNPVVAALLQDGLERAAAAAEVAPIVARMTLRQGNAIELMREWSGEAPQVIYLDPMFPHRDKSALVKKEMRLFRPFVGDDDDAPALLEAALALASHRVVVKRPRKARRSTGRSRATAWRASPAATTSIPSAGWRAEGAAQPGA